MPEKEKTELFKNKNIEIITIKKERGCQIPFNNPIDSLIYLNWSEISRLSDLEKTYGVAHEIAHHFAGRGRTGLREMEAEDLLRTWGFEKEIEAAGYSAPEFEKKGYSIGYEGAKKEFSSSGAHWLYILEHTIYNWENEEMTKDQEKNLIQFINLTSILNESNKEIEDNNIQDKNLDSFMKGVICGIMRRVKELKEQEVSS